MPPKILFLIEASIITIYCSTLSNAPHIVANTEPPLSDGDNPFCFKFLKSEREKKNEFYGILEALPYIV